MSYERKKQKLTQAELAALLEISEKYYQRIESGKVVGKVKIWDELEDLFGISQRELRANTQTSS